MFKPTIFQAILTIATKAWWPDFDFLFFLISFICSLPNRNNGTLAESVRKLTENTYILYVYIESILDEKHPGWKTWWHLSRGILREYLRNSQETWALEPYRFVIFIKLGTVLRRMTQNTRMRILFLINSLLSHHPFSPFIFEKKRLLYLLPPSGIYKEN